MDFKCSSTRVLDMTSTLLCLLFALSAHQQTDHADDLQVLTHGVTALVAPGALPGVLSVTGDAFVLATGTQSKGRVPVFAAAKVELGRVIAASHEGFFSTQALENPSNARLLGNALTWLGRKSTATVRVGLLGYDSMKSALNSAGVTAVSFRLDNIGMMDDSFDVICTTAGALDNNPSAQIQIMRFIKKGHGLLISSPAWGWQQLNPNKDLLADHPGNRMLFPYGITFTKDTAGADYLPQTTDSPLFNTQGAFQALKSGGLSVADRTTAVYTLERALSFLQPSGPGLPSEIIQQAALEPGGGIPSPQTPVGVDKPFSRLKVWMDYLQMKTLTLREVKAYPSSSSFPGAVSDTAKRITQTLTVDTSVPLWHSTGLYAAPGDVIGIQIPDSATNAGLQVHIGPQTDSLWNLDSWPRFPAISIERPINYDQVQVSSAFGGAIYIQVPTGIKLGKIPVTISNGVSAAYYVRGATSPSQWNKMIATADAPWAELQGNLVTLSVPLSSAKKIQDPAALMAFWDQVMKNCYAFYAAPPRGRQERYCPDIEISAGYMHSGYPIMTHMDVADTFCDLAKLKGKGKTWGFYHEMGHNFQQSAWTWDGTGEVTNNLFSLYGNEVMNGVTPETYGDAHPAMAPKAVHDRLVKYLNNGAHYETWRSDAFLALTMYAQLREQFGWEPFTRLFSEYQGLRPNELPKSDLDKRDRWMVRFSKTVGRNLGPFFKAWGVPTSDAARQSIANLPGWMPSDWPVKD